LKSNITATISITFQRDQNQDAEVRVRFGLLWRS